MIKLTVFTAILASLLWVSDTFLFPELVHFHKWLILGFFFLLSLVIQRIIERAAIKNPSKIMSYYFGTLLLRLLLSVLFIGYFIFIKVDDVFIFVINFFIFYLLYVGFEINSLLANLRRNSQ